MRKGASFDNFTAVSISPTLGAVRKILGFIATMVDFLSLFLKRSKNNYKLFDDTSCIIHRDS